MKVKDFISNNVYCLKEKNTIQDCAKLMSENHIGCIPICNENKNIVGLVTDRDIILRGIACDKDVKTTPVSEIMTTKVCCCNAQAEIAQVKDLMCENQIRRLPIIDDSNKIIGIISLGDIAKNNYVDNEDVSETLKTICKCNNKNAQ